MPETNIVVVDFLDLNTSKFTFQKPKPNKHNGTQIGIRYNGETLYVKYDGVTPFGVVDDVVFKPRYWVPLSSVWVPFGFPRKKWVPFINMHNGRVNDVIYCCNLGKKKCVPPY